MAIAITASVAVEARAGVDVTACPGLDAAELTRLLSLEVASLARSPDPIPPFELTLTCESNRVRMVLSDAATDKRLERSIPAPSVKDPGRERTFALAASQLLVASWLELLVNEPPKTATPPPKAVLQIAEKVATRAVAKRTQNQSSYSAGLEGGVSVRDLSAPFPMLHLGARATRDLGDSGLGLGVRVNFDTGSVPRTGGDIQARVLSFGVGPSFRAPRDGMLAFRADLMASALYVHLEGRPSGPGFLGRTTDSFTGEVTLSAGPTLTLSPIEISLSARAGLALPVTEGKVVGDSSVRFGGPWVGGALGMAISN
jgi:hypothetical protein